MLRRLTLFTFPRQAFTFQRAPRGPTPELQRSGLLHESFLSSIVVDHRQPTPARNHTDSVTKLYVPSSSQKRASKPGFDKHTQDHQHLGIEEMDVNSLIKAFSALDLNSSDTTGVEVIAPARETQVNTSLNGHLPTSSSDTAAATPSLTNTSLPPQASLLGLPRELRDQIYGYLTEDESRIILGWQFVQVHKRHYPALSYEGCFASAIALHPLSMTCKQMLTEFQPEHLRATKTRWTFSVNNFDLEQLQVFSDYVNTGTSVKLTDGAGAAQLDPRVYSKVDCNVELRLRFQMDNNAVSSFARLRDMHFTDSVGSFRCLKSARTEIAIRCQPRTGASANRMQGMTKEEAKRIRSSFGEVDHEFARALKDWSDNPSEKFWRGYCDLMRPWASTFARAVADTWAGEEGWYNHHYRLVCSGLRLNRA